MRIVLGMVIGFIIAVILFGTFTDNCTPVVPGHFLKSEAHGIYELFEDL